MERVTRASAANLRDSYLVATQQGARTPVTWGTADGLALLVKAEVFAGAELPQVSLRYSLSLEYNLSLSRALLSQYPWDCPPG